MIVASNIGNKYEIGDKIVIPITEDEYNKLKEIGYEKIHPTGHKFIIVSENAGFTKEQVKEWDDKIKAYYSKGNKLNIRVAETD